MKYLTVKQIMSRYQLSRPKVMRIVKHMETLNRYPEDSIVRMVGKTLVADAALHDYVTHEAQLQMGLPVLEFDRRSCERQLKVLGF